ncbi:MAG TPA: hypothetical protein VIY48_16015 [Candidatus Paceibacterota bacterium]
MAAPTYTWEYVTNLYGLGAPVIVTMEASASLETKVGTMLFMTSGQLDNCTDGTGTIFGLAAEATSAAASSGDAMRVYVLRPGDVIQGTSTADASALTGFASKIQDIDSDQRMDASDQTGGFLSVYRVVPGTSGLTVQCVPIKLDTLPTSA